MKIKSQHLIILSILLIPLFFGIRNIAFDYNIIYATIVKEIGYLFIVVLLYFLTTKFKTKRKNVLLIRLPNFIYLCFILVGLLSIIPQIIIGNFNQLVSLKYYIYDFVIFLLIAKIIYLERSINLIIKSFVGIGIFLSIGALLQILLFHLGIISFSSLESFYSIPVFKSRVSFVATNPNMLAFILTIVLLLTNFNNNKLILDLIILLVILLTGSRIFSLISLIIFFSRYLNKKRYLTFFLIIVIPAIILLFKQLDIYDRLKHTLEVFGNDPRFAIWLALIKNNFNEVTILIGNGFGNVGSYFGITNTLNIPVFYNNTLYMKSINYIDNSFLTIFNETGIIGLSFFLLYLFINLNRNFNFNDKLKVLSFKIQIVIIIASFFGDIFFSYPAFLIYIIFTNVQNYE